MTWVILTEIAKLSRKQKIESVLFKTLNYSDCVICRYIGSNTLQSIQVLKYLLMFKTNACGHAKRAQKHNGAEATSLVMFYFRSEDVISKTVTCSFLYCQREIEDCKLLPEEGAIVVQYLLGAAGYCKTTWPNRSHLTRENLFLTVFQIKNKNLEQKFFLILLNFTTLHQLFCYLITFIKF